MNTRLKSNKKLLKGIALIAVAAALVGGCEGNKTADAPPQANTPPTDTSVAASTDQNAPTTVANDAPSTAIRVSGTSPKADAYDYFLEADRRLVLPSPSEFVAENHFEGKSLDAADKIVKQEDTAFQDIHLGFRYSFQPTPNQSPDVQHDAYRRFARLSQVLAFAADDHSAHSDWHDSVACSLDALELGRRIALGATDDAKLAADECRARGRRPLQFVVDKLKLDDCRYALTRLTAINRMPAPMPTPADDADKILEQRLAQRYQTLGGR